MELWTAAQMRLWEAREIASGRVTGFALMERAAGAVVAAIHDAWPQFGQRAPGHGKGAVVLCGPGNNGGDGYLVAGRLARDGWAVTVVALDRPPATAEAATARAAWEAVGPVSLMGEDWSQAFLDGPHTDIVVDAVFGAGLTRPLPPEVETTLHRLAQRSAFRLVAIDAPSGLCLESGRFLSAQEFQSPLSPACLTVTFHRAKPGHHLAEGPRACGRLVVADIGLPGFHDRDPSIFALRTEDWQRPMLRKTAGHKYDHGHALILSGGVGRGGAARLAARGALRIGAGLVTVGCPAAALIENAARLDAIMLARVADGPGLAALLEDDRINALCLGPGLGLARAEALVPVALSARRATVLDADALTAFAPDPAALFALLHPAVVLTPHAGEFARLFPDLADRLAAPALTGPAFSKLDAARAAAARAGCVVLLKGADTVIADPFGRCRIAAATYENAAPWLATAGSGDVLAGFITGLLARGVSLFHAAGTAAWLHAAAARAFGPGLIAEDLPEQVPAVLRTLGA